MRGVGWAEFQSGERQSSRCDVGGDEDIQIAQGEAVAVRNTAAVIVVSDLVKGFAALWGLGECG